MTAPAIAPNAVTCPKCGGPTWYEVGGKFWGNGLTTNGKAKPTHKCKDKACGGAVWSKDVVNAQTPAPTGKQPVSIGTTGVASLDKGFVTHDPIRAELEAGEGWAELRRTYGECLGFVIDNVVPVLNRSEVGTDPQAVAAIVATIFIERSKRGV